MTTDVHVVTNNAGELELLHAVSGWSVQEEATPVTGDDSTGSVGGFTVTFDPMNVGPAHLKALRKKTVLLDDLGQGRTTGRGESIGTQGGVPTLTVQSRLNLLSVQRKAKPHFGNVLSAVTYYLGLCGIDDMDTVYVDPDLALQPVSLVGFYQPVWNQLKKMALVYHFEIALASDKIIFRPLRQRIAQQYRDAAVDWQIDDSQTAKSIIVNYYEAYPLQPGDFTLNNMGEPELDPT